MSKGKLCPHCQILMEGIVARTHEQSPLFLDQCSTCGGVWFDEGELHRAHGEASAGIDVEHLKMFSTLHTKELLCPNDGSQLAGFKDPSFPDDLVLEHCALCSGFWLKRGVFAAYQKNRMQHIEEAKKPLSPETQRQIELLLNAQSEHSVLSTIGAVGKFLGTRIDPITKRPLEPTPNDHKIEMVAGVLMRLLSLITRS